MSTIGGAGSRGRWFFGRLSSVLGILLSLTGIFFVNNVLTLSFLGIVLGALGTVLGTRRIGIAAVVVSVVVLLFGLAVSSRPNTFETGGRAAWVLLSDDPEDPSEVLH